MKLTVRTSLLKLLSKNVFQRLQNVIHVILSDFLFGRKYLLERTVFTYFPQFHPILFSFVVPVLNSNIIKYLMRCLKCSVQEVKVRKYYPYLILKYINTFQNKLHSLLFQSLSFTPHDGKNCGEYHLAFLTVANEKDLLSPHSIYTNFKCFISQSRI